MGELCAPPTAVGGAALHKHRSPYDNNGQTIDRWSLQEEEEEEEEEPLEKRKLIYLYRKTVQNCNVGLRTYGQRLYPCLEPGKPGITIATR